MDQLIHARRFPLPCYEAAAWTLEVVLLYGSPKAVSAEPLLAWTDSTKTDCQPVQRMSSSWRFSRLSPSATVVSLPENESVSTVMAQMTFRLMIRMMVRGVDILQKDSLLFNLLKHKKNAIANFWHVRPRAMPASISWPIDVGDNRLILQNSDISKFWCFSGKLYRFNNFINVLGLKWMLKHCWWVFF